MNDRASQTICEIDFHYRQNLLIATNNWTDQRRHVNIRPMQTKQVIQLPKVSIERRGNDVVLMYVPRPGVEVSIPAEMLQRWALRVLRDKVFAQ